MVVLGQRGTRLALAGLCLAALSATAGAPLFAAQAQKPSSAEADWISPSAGVDVEALDVDLASHGGALYSPFSTGSDTAVSPPLAYAMPVREGAKEESPDLVAAAVAALVAAGLLVVLVRVLIAS